MKVAKQITICFKLQPTIILGFSLSLFVYSNYFKLLKLILLAIHVRLKNIPKNPRPIYRLSYH